MFFMSSNEFFGRNEAWKGIILMVKSFTSNISNISVEAMFLSEFIILAAVLLQDTCALQRLQSASWFHSVFAEISMESPDPSCPSCRNLVRLGVRLGCKAPTRIGSNSHESLQFFSFFQHFRSVASRQLAKAHGKLGKNRREKRTTPTEIETP